jgi:hypothetical protein
MNYTSIIFLDIVMDAIQPANVRLSLRFGNNEEELSFGRSSGRGGN